MFGHPRCVLKTPPTLEGLAKLILEELSSVSLKGIILGLPLLFSGKEGDSAQLVRELASHLEKLAPSIPIHFIDERLTTCQVEKSMKEAEMSRKKRAKCIDKGVATLLLQTFLDTPHI